MTLKGKRRFGYFVTSPYVQDPWRKWSEAEKPRRETIKICDDFFSLQQSIRAMDGEQGLEVVWGMGMARWRLDDGRTIDHPIVEQLVEIDMDTTTGRINLHPRPTEPQVVLKPFFGVAPVSWTVTELRNVGGFGASFRSRWVTDSRSRNACVEDCTILR